MTHLTRIVSDHLAGRHLDLILGPKTLIVGPEESGKTTTLNAIRVACRYDVPGIGDDGHPSELAQLIDGDKASVAVWLSSGLTTTTTLRRTGERETRCVPGPASSRSTEHLIPLRAAVGTRPVSPDIAAWLDSDERRLRAEVLRLIGQTATVTAAQVVARIREQMPEAGALGFAIPTGDPLDALEALARTVDQARIDAERERREAAQRVARPIPAAPDAAEGERLATVLSAAVDELADLRVALGQQQEQARMAGETQAERARLATAIAEGEARLELLTTTLAGLAPAPAIMPIPSESDRVEAQVALRSAEDALRLAEDQLRSLRSGLDATAEAQARRAELEREIASLTASLAETASPDASAQIAALTAQRDGLGLMAMRARQAEMATQIEALRPQIDERRATLSERQGALRALEGFVGALESGTCPIIGETCDRIAGQAIRIAGAREAVTKQQATLDDLTRQRATLEEERKALVTEGRRLADLENSLSIQIRGAEQAAAESLATRDRRRAQAEGALIAKRQQLAAMPLTKAGDSSGVDAASEAVRAAGVVRNEAQVAHDALRWATEHALSTNARSAEQRRAVETQAARLHQETAMIEGAQTERRARLAALPTDEAPDLDAAELAVDEAQQVEIAVRFAHRAFADAERRFEDAIEVKILAESEVDIWRRRRDLVKQLLTVIHDVQQEILAATLAPLVDRVTPYVPARVRDFMVDLSGGGCLMGFRQAGAFVPWRCIAESLRVAWLFALAAAVADLEKQPFRLGLLDGLYRVSPGRQPEVLDGLSRMHADGLVDQLVVAAHEVPAGWDSDGWTVIRLERQVEAVTVETVETLGVPMAPLTEAELEMIDRVMP